MNSNACSPTPAPAPSPAILVLRVRGAGEIPSFKNTKRAIRDRKTGKLRTLTPGPIKQRMQAIEDAILSELCSASRTIVSGTLLACWKPLPIALSGLCDDSTREIPQGSWDTVQVEPGEEGADIFIFELPAQ